MNFTNIGLHNLNQPGLDALQFSLMGMGLVFGGLLIIALYITLLPRLLELGQPKAAKWRLGKPSMMPKKKISSSQLPRPCTSTTTFLTVTNGSPGRVTAIWNRPGWFQGACTLSIAENFQQPGIINS